MEVRRRLREKAKEAKKAKDVAASELVQFVERMLMVGNIHMGCVRTASLL
jgi:glutamate racemase